MIFQLIAVILLGIFYSCYFGKMIVQRRKGIQTDQIGKGKTAGVPEFRKRIRQNLSRMEFIRSVGIRRFLELIWCMWGFC